MEQIQIAKAELTDLKPFMSYLKSHLSENGVEGVLFQPMSNKQLKLDEEWEEKFRIGMTQEFGGEAWRQLWLAKHDDGTIMGHIDIRSRKELNTSHRVLLGMGVDHNFRRLKIGQKLLAHVIDYANNHPEISWIDLEVLSHNLPAVSLYLKNGFVELGEYKDMFRIEQKSYAYKMMTLEVERS